MANRIRWVSPTPSVATTAKFYAAVLGKPPPEREGRHVIIEVEGGGLDFVPFRSR